MVYESIFDYLKEDSQFKNIHSKCIEMEKAMMDEAYSLSLISGRIISELLIKIFIKHDKKLSKKFFKKNEDGSVYHPKLSHMLKDCQNKKILDRDIIDKYYILKRYGDPNAHGESSENYSIADLKKVHCLVFDLSLNCFNEFNIKKNISYEYRLDKKDYKLLTSLKEREEQIKYIRSDEVSRDDLIEYLKLKKIFIPKESFLNILNKYDENVIDLDKFNDIIEETDYITDENIESILEHFDDSVNKDMYKEIKELHNNISNGLFSTLKELNETDLSFEELNYMIANSEDSNQKFIYENIKILASSLAKSQLAESIQEIKNIPVTETSENGRIEHIYKNYEINEDDFGFSIKEVDENILPDEDQREAIEYSGEKALVINAGPGSGKTRVIIDRVVYLVNELKKDPSSILVITFTRKATQELRKRLIQENQLNIDDVNQIRISTVHSFCRYVISNFEGVPYNFLSRDGERSLFFKKHKEELGFTKYAFLYDYYIPVILKKYDEYFSFKVKTNQFENEYLLEMMNEYEDQNKRYENFMDNYFIFHNIDDYPNRFQENFKSFKNTHYYYLFLNLVRSYPKYKELLENTRTCDDNTSLEKANEILENDYILNQLPYKNILIDEFQDTDFHQKSIFEKLRKISDTFTIVGDIDQSIYGWRGAFPEYFEEFCKEDDIKYVTLHTNYRSTKDIVEFNEELIKDKRAVPKEIKAKKKYKAPIFHLNSENNEEEILNIISLIKNLKNNKKIKYYSDVAILFRKNRHIENIIGPLEASGIPYHLKENKDLLKQEEIKAMLTMLWYLMPYEKTKYVHLGDDFLNLYGFTDERYKSSHIFKFSQETLDILNNIQRNYDIEVENIAKATDKIYFYDNPYSYRNLYNMKENVLKQIFLKVKTFDIGLLNRDELIELGIKDENDLLFFLKLNTLKSEIMNGKFNNGDIIDITKIFYDLLNITDYFTEISIENNPEDKKVKQNLAKLSQIIKDYGSIMGYSDFKGLFIYLNRVLTGYSSHHDENDEFDKVHVLSIHSAKGLEYPVVILGSLEDPFYNPHPRNEKFPTPRIYLELKPSTDYEARKKYYDEELRDVYVATTRAKEILILSTVTDNELYLPGIVKDMKNNPNVKFRDLKPHHISLIPKIESSKEYHIKTDYPTVKFDNFLDDYIFCPMRYDFANNTKFKVRLKNDKYINIILHNLLENIHSNKINSAMDVEKKIDTIIKNHNINQSVEIFRIFNNVKDYWIQYGSHYNVFRNKFEFVTKLRYCNLVSQVDLIVQEDDGSFSVVKFIPTDSNIPSKDMYNSLLHFYINQLKEFKEYDGYEFKNIYLHSLENNQRYVFEYDEEKSKKALNLIDKSTKNIYDNNWTRFKRNCENCEYFGTVCRG